MKFKKLYLGLIIAIMAAAIFAGIRITGDTGIAMGNVNMKDMALPDKWQDLIAESMNQNSIRLVVNGKEISFSDSSVYMSENNEIMIPSYLFRDTFKCAFNIYSDGRIKIQKSNSIAEINNENSFYRNGIYQEINNAFQYKNGKLFINSKILEDVFEYTYQWDARNNSLSLNDTHKDENILPSSYSYRKEGKLPSVKNQKYYSTCWAFAALTALETTLMPKEGYEFSVDNMVYNNGYEGSYIKGGDYTRAMAYLLAWKGPVLEADDVYGDGYTNLDAKPVKHIQEIQILESKNLESIKRAVFLYGGVESSLYTDMSNTYESSVYYNESTYSYCYVGTKRPNHDVVIVGWDDNYSASNFSVKPASDGAFLCLNSWGGEFGDNGLFYVSYYDSNIGVHNVVYTGAESINNYDNIYQSDLCGWIGQLGYEEDTAYFSNVYEAKGNEEVEAVGFYATGKNTSYEVYFVDNFQNEDSFSERVKVASGKFTNSGYYTVKFDEHKILQEGHKYAVVVKVTTPDSVHPVAVEYKAGRDTRNVIIDDGEGYISRSGRSWEPVESSKSCNVCLKMYTKNMGE